MKDIIKKYNQLDTATKDLLYEFHLLNELSFWSDEYPNVDLSNSTDKQKVLIIALSCSMVTNLDGGEIIRKILEILNNKEATLNELENLSVFELGNLVKEEDNPKVISEFIHDGCFCMCSKHNEKYILMYSKEEDDIRVIIFNNLEEMLSTIVEKDLQSNPTESKPDV